MDDRGNIICPNCGKHYQPELGWPDRSDTRRIQEIYPDAIPYQREQLVSGLCSDRCWDEYLGVATGKQYDGMGRQLGRKDIVDAFKRATGREPSQEEEGCPAERKWEEWGKKVEDYYVDIPEDAPREGDTVELGGMEWDVIDSYTSAEAEMEGILHPTGHDIINYVSLGVEAAAAGKAEDDTEKQRIIKYWCDEAVIQMHETDEKTSDDKRYTYTEGPAGWFKDTFYTVMLDGKKHFVAVNETYHFTLMVPEDY
jgi:hypothetical protein